MRLAMPTLALALFGCGESGPVSPPAPPAGPPAAELSCGGAPLTVTLEAGQEAVLDAQASAGCLRLQAGQATREYLLVAYSAAMAVTPGGSAAPYRWRSRSSGSATATPTLPESAAASGALAFHHTLREAERRLAERPRPASAPLAAPAAPPIVGDRRTFGVCADLGCATLATVPTTAAYVGRRVAVFVDDSVPPGGFQAADLARIGRLFDDYLYPIDTTAFGRESDVDGNGVVLAVITRQVNRLCPDAGGVVTGYFYGLDLTPTEPGSNGGEVFYTLAPDPNGLAGCRVTPEFVERNIPGTFIHEFQHMISFNQHVLMRGGPAEATWLNEGLSHLAEELGGRRIPDGNCLIQDCLSQFSFNDVANAYRYLFNAEDYFLVYPEGSSGRLAERGASWLLVRWLADHYGSGDAATRSLLATSRTGGANVEALTGRAFAAVLGEWHLANYLDDLPGVVAANPRLRYPSWNWRVTFPGLRAQFPSLYPRSFPLVPDSTAGSYDRGGVLRGGSGRHLRVVLGAGDPAVDLKLDDGSGGGLSNATAARIAIARIR